MKAKFLVVLLTLLIIAILFVLSYRENGVITYPVYKESSIKGFRLEHKENNQVQWELQAQSAKFPEGSEEITLADLRMDIHQERKITLTGGSGTYKLKEKSLTVYRPVEIDIEDSKLVTDSLTWNSSEGLISTENDIKFEGKNFLIQGTGLVAKIKAQQIRILKNVKAVFYR